MSVYTHLSHDEFFAFCSLFGVTFKKAIPIVQGIKNSNWFIQAEHDHGDDFSYVFTLYEERAPEDIIKMATVMHTLKDKLPIAAPLIKQTATGEHIGKDCVMRYENKAILIVPKSGRQPPCPNHPSDVSRDGARLGGIAPNPTDLTAHGRVWRAFVRLGAGQGARNGIYADR